MKTVIEKIKSNERLPDILRALVDVDAKTYDNAHQMVNDTDVTQIGILISSRLNIGGVDATVATGGLVFFYQRLTDCESRRGLPDKLLEDLGVSQSQVYRCVDVWKRFGELLINSPQLKAYFVVEALKRLSGDGVDALARESAIQMAQRKEKVHIADVERIIAQFSSDDEAREEGADKQSKPRRRKAAGKKNPQSLRGKKRASIWEYAGKAVRFVLRPAQSKHDVDHESIIRDLEAALALYRKEFENVAPVPLEKHRPKGEVSHA